MTDKNHSDLSDDNCTALRVRMETLEIRSTHQEAALEELTRTLLEQERQVRELIDALRRLEAQVRAATPAPLATREEEGPPPHY
ncbi:MAG: SlyX family protein [Thiohalobacteraceae bacterium]